MRRLRRVVLLVGLVAIAPVLAGCEDFDMDKFDVFGINQKKKLPGERKELFPEGVPGVTQGIPPEYLKGNQPPPETAQTPAAEPPTTLRPHRRARRLLSLRPKSRSRNPSASRNRARRRVRPPVRSPFNQRPGAQTATSKRRWSPGQARTRSKGNRASSRHPDRAPARLLGRQRRRPAPSRAKSLARLRERRPFCAGRTAAHELHHRHCRPPQCRQVDAVQPAGRPARRAGRRPAGRDARPARRRWPARRS